MRYRYLIWQFDGALFDTAGALRQASASALACFGIVPAPARIAALVDEAGGAAATHVAHYYGLPAAAFQVEWQACYRAILLKIQPPQPGAVDLCLCMAEAGGHNYLYAARRPGDVSRLLAAYGMAPLFTGWLTADPAGPAPNRPDYRLLLAGCGLLTDATLLITNRPADVHSGQAAGLATCWFGPNPPTGAACAITDYALLINHVCAAGEVVS